MEDYTQFKNPAVRDLAWVMQSPSLIEGSNSSEYEVISDNYCTTVYESSKRWLQKLDGCPRQLTEFLSRRPSARLGCYFEDLVAYWLEQQISQGYFESHVKVSDGNRDLGEFDFLFRSENRYYHWETAVKFYLYWMDNYGQVTWFGPNANDTLAKKLDKLINHQIRMRDLPESNIVLSEKGIDAAKIHPQIFLKGYLFYPMNENKFDMDFGEYQCRVSSEHLTGWWLSIDKLEAQASELFSSDSFLWQSLPRRKWLAPRFYKPNEERECLKPGWQIVADLLAHFKQSDNSLLIAGYSPDRQGQWQEQTRGFVVSGNWPA